MKISINKYELASVMYNYEKYKETSLIGRNIRYENLQGVIKKLEHRSLFKIVKTGSSFNGRDINLIKVGSGKTKVFMWSQMHGDESTSTRAICDLLNFLSANDDCRTIREKIFNSVSLFIVPMLNPDGAENYTRENAQMIDINRDAIAQQTPEGKLLYKLKNEIQPEFGFNLHDQSSGYSAGLNYKPSTISLLAPPFNEAVEINEIRIRAMKLIVSLYKDLNEIIPGHIARYDDEFEPRAFGDNFTKDGVSTILIEAGGWSTDPDREYVRKIYFSALVKSLLTIADKSYEAENESEYFDIPENKERLFDLIIRNVLVYRNEKIYKVDIAIKREELFDETSNRIFYKGTIADFGDLSTFFGYDDYNLDKHFLELPQIAGDENMSIENFLKNKIAYIKSNQSKQKWIDKPINTFNLIEPNLQIELDGLANFFLTKNGQTKFAVINGFLIDLSKNLHFTGNGLVLP